MKSRLLSFLGSIVFLFSSVGNRSASVFGWYEPK